MLAAVVTAICSLTIGTASINSFACLVLFRVMHGIISSAINPLSYSLIADLFPSDKRSTANSILSSAVYVGIALSSLTILLIKNFGWRSSYLIMGGSGMLFAGIIALFMTHPKRGTFETPLTAE
jgi:ACS family D-galactonate transporter-like MFS transporter